MARGRSTRAGAALAKAPASARPRGRAEAALSGLGPALDLVAAALPVSRAQWCPAEIAAGHGGARRARLTEAARRHESLVREAGSLVEAAARALAEPEIAGLSGRLRALEAAGDDPLATARRRRITEHEIPAARQRALRRALAAARPFGAPPGSGPVHRYAPGTDSAARALVEEACAHFPRAWLARSRSDSALVPFACRLGQAEGRPEPAGWRGSYEHSGDESVLRLALDAPVDERGGEYAAHELTHRLEALVPGIDRLAWAYRMRAAEEGALTEATSGYASHVYRADGPDAVSELMACGVQSLAAEPARFDAVLGRDAGYRHLVLGALALA